MSSHPQKSKNTTSPQNHNSVSSFQIANGLRILRKANGYSLHDLQDTSGIHRYTLNAYEHNIIEPTGTDVFIIISVLGMSIDDFYQFVRNLIKHEIKKDIDVFVNGKKIEELSKRDPLANSQTNPITFAH